MRERRRLGGFRDELVQPAFRDRPPVEQAGGIAQKQARAGVVFQPLRNRWSVSRDTDINYMMSARRL
jgi:2-polyprenyl-3-methyl-5-hydroxy-6-metoxy-1,4-benzoquinol methylase